MCTPCGRRNSSSPQERRKLPFAVEHDHRMLAAREHVNIILAVHPDRGNFAIVPAVRQFSPVFDDLEPILA
jgi:hypothetical protein